eukprot:SAG11_NODE_635_length_8040_cov_3.233472_4_plen_33_part_00
MLLWEVVRALDHTTSLDKPMFCESSCPDEKMV